MRRSGFFLALVAWSAAPAQPSASGSQPIGTISGGNPVFLEPKSVKRAGDEITASFRTTFLKPAKVPGGEWYGSRTLVTVRCKAGTAAVKENRYYSDAKLTKVASEKIVGIPGYGAPVPGSVTALALEALCSGQT